MTRINDLIAKLCPDGVEFTTLSEVASVYDGTHQTPKYIESGVKFVSVENINELYESKKYISEDDFDRNYKVKPRTNDVFMTRIGTIGACAVIENDEPLAYYVTLALIRPNPKLLNSSYLKFVIESRMGVAELRKRTLVNATPIKINLGEIGKIRIPVPPLAIQQEIVKVLATFKELEAQLEGELKARRQQFEYYSERLLTFKEAQ